LRKIPNRSQSHELQFDSLIDSVSRVT
jgi:hypothetical protein